MLAELSGYSTQILPSIVAAVSGFGTVVVAYFLSQQNRKTEALRQALESKNAVIEQIRSAVTRIEDRVNSNHDAIAKLSGKEESLTAGRAFGRAEAASQADAALKIKTAADTAEGIVKGAEAKAMQMLQEAEAKVADKLNK